MENVCVPNVTINSSDFDIDNHKHTATVNVSEIPEGRNVGEVTPFGVCTCALLTAISVATRPNREAFHSGGAAVICVLIRNSVGF